MYSAYGSSKAAIRQLAASLSRECRGKPGLRGAGVHTVSPGMVLTDLLLEGATPAGKAAFNALCEQPETVAAELVPKLRKTVGTGSSLDYLTPGRAVLRLLSLPFVQGRFFDGSGRATYPPEAQRIARIKAARERRRRLWELELAEAEAARAHGRGRISSAWWGWVATSSSAVARAARKQQGGVARALVASTQLVLARTLRTEGELVRVGVAYSAALVGAFVVLVQTTPPAVW